MNYDGNQSQCYVRLPLPDLVGRSMRLENLMGPSRYNREGAGLVSSGLYVDLPPWAHHVFAIRAG